MKLLERKASRELVTGNMDEEVLYYLDAPGVEYKSNQGQFISSQVLSSLKI